MFVSVQYTVYLSCFDSHRVCVSVSVCFRVRVPLWRRGNCPWSSPESGMKWVSGTDRAPSGVEKAMSRSLTGTSPGNLLPHIHALQHAIYFRDSSQTLNLEIPFLLVSLCWEFGCSDWNRVVFQLSVLHTGSNCSRRSRNWSVVLRLSCKVCGLSSRGSWERWRSGWRPGTWLRPRAWTSNIKVSWRSWRSSSKSRWIRRKNTGSRFNQSFHNNQTNACWL